MVKFIYFPQSRKIVLDKTQRRVKLQHVYEMFLDEKPLEILEAYTLRDVKDEVLTRFGKSKGNPLSKMNEEEYGPGVPLNKTRLYNCQDCDTPTPNRFKCSKCWETISERDDLDFIYVI